MRYALHNNPDSAAIYLVEDLFVVLSPCAFIAGDYILLAHLASYLKTPDFLLISPKAIAKVFIWSDVSTFLIQAAGGGISISTNVSTALAGAHVSRAQTLMRNAEMNDDNLLKLFLAGLVLQLVSFFFFACIFVRFMILVRIRAPEIWKKDEGKKWYEDWRSLARAMQISCAGILVSAFPFAHGPRLYITCMACRFAARIARLSSAKDMRAISPPPKDTFTALIRCHC